ncbi:MAG: C4-type zinc ribbon domain-containing protein [Spirochaetia bacterium]|nr:C4-type zinc ribbon domain-containing protein [Spirochaetia bacterium]
MMMQETFEKLQALQDVLVQKYNVEKELEEIPKAIITKKETLIRLKKQFIDKSAALEKRQFKVRDLKSALKDTEERRGKFERDMDVIKTQKEYELLDKAIKEAIAEEQQLRKDLLKEEKETAELNQDVEKEGNLINGLEEELRLEEEKIQAESEVRKLELAKLEEEKSKIIPGLDEEILFKFERIIKSKEGGLGIVPVRGVVCSACHMILPAQFVNDIRHGDKIEFCPYCSRILFYEEGSDDEADMIFDYSNEVGGFAGLDEEEEEEENLEDDNMDDKSSDMDVESETFVDDEEEVYDEEAEEEDEAFEEEEGFGDEEFDDEEEEEDEFSDDKDDGDEDDEDEDDDEDDDDDASLEEMIDEEDEDDEDEEEDK